MKKFIHIMMLFLVFVPQSCNNKQTLSPSEKEKLDPQLQQLLLEDGVTEKRYNVSMNENGKKVYGVIILTKNPEDIKRLGIHLNSVHGEIVTAKLRPEEIRNIVNLNSVQYLENSKKNYPH